MNTPRHATDDEIEELWDLLHLVSDVEAVVAPHGDMRGLDDWMAHNEREAS